MNYVFSATDNAFYPLSMRQQYVDAGTWPADAVQVSDDIFNEFTGPSPIGKIRGVVSEMPAWADLPPPTQDEYIAMAEQERKRRIDAANDYMDSRQWPGKAAMKRLSTDDFAKYNLWLDYLDALEAISTSSAPDIEWPIQPVSAAS